MAHTVRSFDEELDNLMELTNQLGTAVVGQIDAALRALTDPTAAADIGLSHDAIGDLWTRVDTQAVRILALRAPVAEDLRFVVAALKVASSLKQTADHAISIGERAGLLKGSRPHRSLRSLRRLGEDVRMMQEKVIKAFADRDADKAMEVWHYDQVVDEQHSGLFRELLTYMMEDAKNITVCSELVFIAKDFERIGDQATNIAEMVYFLANGTPPNVARPKSDTAASTGG